MCIVSQSSSVVTGFLAGPVMVVSHASSVVTGFLDGPVMVISCCLLSQVFWLDL